MNTAATQIVFIDAAVQEREAILASLTPGAASYVLDSSRDGLQQMADILQDYRGLDAIHVISHGSVGSLQLGSTVVTQDTLEVHSGALADIGNALAETGDILLYGCNVAQGDEGQAFIDSFAQFTEADVAASDDLTGASFLVGDVNLEFSSGEVTSSPLLVQAVVDDARVLLLTTISNGFRHPLGNGVLTEALDGDGYYVPNDLQVYDGGNYGARFSPALPLSFHLGEDWNAEDETDLGDPVYAISNGYVTQAGTFAGTSSLGNYIVIRHDLPVGSEIFADGAWRTQIVSLYAHLNRIDVSEGQTVSIGQQIGQVGSSGTTASHLHFEIRLGTEYTDTSGYADHGVDPIGWVDPTDFINAHRTIATNLPDLDAREDSGYQATLNTSSVVQGANVTLTYRVSNWGSANAGASTSGIYLSTDSVYDSGDGFLTIDSIAPLTANTGSTETVTFSTSGIAAGSYYIFAVANYNKAIAEVDVTNNPSNGVALTVTAASAAGSVSINDVTLSEGDSGTKVASFTVTRSGGTAAFSVDYGTTNGTATASSDYLTSTGRLLFDANVNTQTVSVTVNGDTTVEANESFYVNLSAATNDATISDQQGIGTITNDDSTPANQPPTISGPTNITQTTGQTISFTSLISAVDSDGTVAQYRFSDSSPGTDNGYLTLIGQQITNSPVTVSAGNLSQVGYFTGSSAGSNSIAIEAIDDLGLPSPNYLTTTINVTEAEVAGSVSINDVTLSEGDSGTKVASFTVTRTGGTAAFSVDFITADGTATGFSDYMPNAQTLSFGSNINTQAASVIVYGDPAVEANETFYVNLSAPTSGATISDGQGVGSITNDDVPPANQAPFVTILAASSYAAGTVLTGPQLFSASDAQGESDIDFVKVYDANATNGAVWKYNYSVITPGGAGYQFEYANRGLLTYTVGTGSNDFQIEAVDHAGAASNAPVGSITGNVAVAGSVSISDITVPEGNSGTTVATFTVTRTGGTAAFSVEYATANNTATAASDYVAAAGMLSFGTNVNTQTVSVTINGDTTVEANETFYVNLSAATSGATISDGQGVGTITNDDAVVADLPDLTVSSLALGSASVVSGATTTVSYTVTNIGTQGSVQSILTAVYLSSDPTITTSDALISLGSTSALFAGGSQASGNRTIDFSRVTPGTYYVGAIVDYDNEVQEGREDNNVSNVVAINVIAAPNHVGSVTIAGTQAQGQTLTAVVADPDSTAGPIGYQWKANGHVIDGATGSTLVLTEAQVGTVITVTADYTDGVGKAESVSSVPLAAGFQPQASYATGNYPMSVAVGDFNGDGRHDLAVANYSANTMSVLAGNADGTFSTLASYATGNLPIAIAVADLNGDGHPDIAVANSASATVSVLTGNANGTFNAQTTYSAGNRPSGVAIGDLNGDGRLDLAVTTSGSASVSVLTGNADGTFNARTVYATGTQPVAVAIGDLNGDGLADLAVANSASNTVSVLTGNASGTLNTQTTYATGTQPVAVAIGDLNGDGRQDLAVANVYPDTVSVLTGNANGTLNAQTTYPAGSSPRSIAIGDINGDGRPDLAVANQSSSVVSVLTSNDNGTLNAQTNYATAAADSYSVAIGDFNGDHYADLAGANAAANSVSVLLGASVQVANLNDRGVVAIAGTATHGQVLVANVTDLDGVPATITYQWQANGTDIQNATARTCMLTAAEVGKTITVAASYNDRHGTPEAVSSLPTRAVLAANQGTSGADALTALTGADTLSGGAGDDGYTVFAPTNRIVELFNEGTDTVQSPISWALGANLENLDLTGTRNVSATGNALGNQLTGNDSNNILNGGVGADTLIGRSGDDTYIVDNIGDVIQETDSSISQIDTVRASLSWTLGNNLENLILTGSKGISGTGNNLDNSLTGNGGNNILNGGDGRDILNGAAGNDILTGGNGNDIFVFANALNPNTNVDTITDFTSGSDKLQLSQAIFSQLDISWTVAPDTFNPTPASDAFFHAGSAAHDADDRIFYDSATGALSYDADGSGAAAAVQFATLVGATPPILLYSDFTPYGVFAIPA